MTAASCLRFEEISDTSTTSSYIKFTNDGDQYNAGDGCWSYVGEQGGEHRKRGQREKEVAWHIGERVRRGRQTERERER